VAALQSAAERAQHCDGCRSSIAEAALVVTELAAGDIIAENNAWPHYNSSLYRHMGALQPESVPSERWRSAVDMVRAALADLGRRGADACS